MGQLESNFSYAFAGKVWNLMLTEDGEHLLFEIRDDQAYKTSYFMLNLLDFHFNLNEVIFEEDWWIGVTYATNRLVLFHTFENQDNPDNKSYFAFDVEQSKVLWQKNGLNITDVNAAIALNINSSNQEKEFINLNSGEKTPPSEFKPSIQNKKLDPTFHYPEGSDYFTTVSKFLAPLLNIHIVGGVNYFQSKKRIIISYYVKQQEGLLNALIVLNKKKEILLQQTLGKGLSGISDNTFFIYDDNLIFVKEKHHFFIYPLTEK